ncbi:MAG: F0F1 ATP synthase subunit A [Pseudomonadota bacterium]
MANDPISQFQIKNILSLGEIGGAEIAFTNSALFMVASVGTIVLFLMLATSGRTLVPTRMQSIAELLYSFVANTVRSTTGTEGMRFFPFIFSLFMFVLLCNLFGMFPYFFTVTSHIIVTFTLAMVVILLVLFVGFSRHGTGFLKLFVPDGVPGAILPFITLIEVISFLSRPISLSLRLFGNMLAGHIVLKVFAGFVVTMGAAGFAGVLGAVFPFAMTIALTAFEFLIAALQAYVFTVLTCVYLNDALHPHH